MLRYAILTDAMTVQCDVYVNMLTLCKVHVEVVKKSVLLFQKVSVSGTQTKPLTTKIHEMCSKVWLLQDLRVSDHVILPHVDRDSDQHQPFNFQSLCLQKTSQNSGLIGLFQVTWCVTGKIEWLESEQYVTTIFS